MRPEHSGGHGMGHDDSRVCTWGESLDVEPTQLGELCKEAFRRGQSERDIVDVQGWIVFDRHTSLVARAVLQTGRYTDPSLDVGTTRSVEGEGLVARLVYSLHSDTSAGGHREERDGAGRSEGSGREGADGDSTGTVAEGTGHPDRRYQSELYKAVTRISLPDVEVQGDNDEAEGSVGAGSDSLGHGES